MSCLIYLVSHASHDWLGRGIAGRQRGVHLNDQGRQEALALAERLSRQGIIQIFTSPMERALETAEPLARKVGLEASVLDGINEVDFGDWTGRSITELDQLSAWKQW